MTPPSQVDPVWLATQFADLSNLTPLSAGGQKQVFSATHTSDGDVVLKLLHPGSDLARTQRELRASAQVRSTRIPKILGDGQLTTPTGTIFWFREQRVQGEPLSVRIKTRPLTAPELLRLALHVSETLAAAEVANIVHRDVKPANIIVDTSGAFWLIDFGVARHLDLDSLTATGLRGGWGTLGYAPIEQCRNDKPEIDARADLFALGVTLYEAATGSNPHIVGARDPHEILKRIAAIALPRLSPPLPSDLADLVATLAQPNCVHRIQTAKEAHEWIADLCTKEGIQ